MCVALFSSSGVHRGLDLSVRRQGSSTFVSAFLFWAGEALPVRDIPVAKDSSPLLFPLSFFHISFEANHLESSILTLRFQKVCVCVQRNMAAPWSSFLTVLVDAQTLSEHVHACWFTKHRRHAVQGDHLTLSSGWLHGTYNTYSCTHWEDLIQRCAQ